MYMNDVIRGATANNNKLTDEMVINMNTDKVADGEEESYLEIKKFWNEIERQKEK